MMLGLLRCGRAGGAIGSHAARLTNLLLAAEAPAALSSQGYFTAAAVSTALTNLRLFDADRAARASIDSPLDSADWRHSAGSSCSTAFRQIVSSAACQAAADATSAPAAGANPLQSFAAGNPLSAVPIAAAKERARIATATLRHAKISEKKLNDFARVVRKMHVDEAILQCQASIKKASRMVHKLLESARANGENNHGLDPSRLYVEQLLVGRAKILKRMEFRGRGRIGKIHKRRSHMTVILRELDAGEAPPRRVTRIFPPYLQRLRERKQ